MKLISSFDLSARIGKNPNLRVIDATFVFPDPNGSPKSAQDYFEDAHIPGARFFDQTVVVDPDALHDGMEIRLTHPKPDVLAAHLAKMDVRRSHDVVLYDREGGILTAARAARLLKSVGFKEVSLLEGGFQEWMCSDLEVETGKTETFSAPPEVLHEKSGFFVDYNDLNGDIRIVDFRSGPDDFMFLDQDEIDPSKIPEAAAQISAFELMEEGATGLALKGREALGAIFKDVGLVPEDRTICTCNFGMLASVGALAMKQAGFEDVQVLRHGWAPHLKKA